MLDYVAETIAGFAANPRLGELIVPLGSGTPADRNPQARP
jgi:hypothetical protein